MKIIVALALQQAVLITCAFNKFENEKCSSDFTGDNGVCLEGRNCPAFKTNRNQLEICSFRGRVPIVCCPEGIELKSGVDQSRISSKKCNEFHQLPAENPRFVRQASSQLATLIDGGVIPTFVGGIRVVENEFPHMAAIGWREDGGSIDWKCGGSLISDKFVLSAAHCSSHREGKPQVIRVGVDDLSRPSGRFQEFGIQQIVVHPQYRGNLQYHDVALFELDKSATLSANFKPACLYQSDDDTASPIEAMGFGQTSFAGPKSDHLLKGSLTIVNNSECNKAYDEDTSQLPQGITAMQICAWDPDGNRDTCQGDSGGPLQTTKYTAESVRYYELIGVTSFGKYCAAGVPGVYARVHSYLDWIESVVWPSN